MTTPTFTDIMKAARDRLLADSQFSSLLGTDVGQDTMSPTHYSGAYNDGWVFRGQGDDDALEREVMGTSTSAVTLSMRDRWGGPNDHNTLRFPLLRVVIYSDLTRPVTNNALIRFRDAEDRCSRVADAVYNVFHDPANRNHWWTEDVFIVSSLCHMDLRMRDMPTKSKSDGVVRGEMRFALETF